MSVVDCEYVRLFYHVPKGSSGSPNKKYVKVDCFSYRRNRLVEFSAQQKYKRRWLVLRMDFSPVECRLEHYDKEASWQNQKEGQVEYLSEMEDVRVLANNEKDHVLEVVLTNRSLFISFDSKTKLNAWKEKVSTLLGERHHTRALLWGCNAFVIAS